MKAIIITIVVLLVGCSELAMSVPPTKYRFESISLPDGTPCTVVKGGTHSGMVGITCNYGKK